MGRASTLSSTAKINSTIYHEKNQIFSKERLRKYPRYVYEAGGLQRYDSKLSITIDPKVLEKERKTGFEATRFYRFRYCTRYFTDSGIIGSRDFVSRNYKRFKDLFQSKHEKKPKLVKGLEGIYSPP